jgi:hypothetical protein
MDTAPRPPAMPAASERASFVNSKLDEPPNAFEAVDT